MINIVINGCNGLMGATITSMVSKMDDAQIICGVDKYPDYKKQPYKVYDDISKVVEPVDVVVDFSRPDATADLCAWSINKKCALLIATTGLGMEEYALLHDASKLIPVFHSANMSLGINLMIQLIKKSASFLGDAFDIEIVEKHHNQKVDAPSGTALALANEINSVLDPKKEFIYGRHTKTQKRTKSEIGIHSLRGGTIVGEHQVNFIGTDEYIEITHAAHSKQVFAQGAIRAALYITGKTNGFYSMEDMLLENSGITALKASEDIAMITCMAKNASMILSALSDINIDMISQSLPGKNGTTLSCTLPEDDLPKATQSLKSQGIHFTSNSNVAQLVIDGEGMDRLTGIAANLLTTLQSKDVEPLSVTTSPIEICLCIPSEKLELAISVLKEEFAL